MLLYVADAVDPDERAEIDRLLSSGDADALAARAEADRAFAAVADGVEPVEPKAATLERVMAGVESPHAETGEDDAPAARIGPSWLRPAAVLLVGVAVGVAATAGYFADHAPPSRIASLTGDLADVRDRLAARDRRLAQLEDRLTEQAAVIRAQTDRLESQQDELEAQTQLIARQRRRLDDASSTLALLLSPSLRSVELAGTDEQPAATGRLLWDPGANELRLFTADLVRLADDRDYQLWFVPESGDPISLGVFDVDDAGLGTLRESLPDVAAQNLKLAAISLEPAGGSRAPTGPIVAAGEIPSP